MSNTNEQFPTGAVRDQRGGKGRFDLIRWPFLYRLARVMEEGAKKYGERNWEAGIPLARSLDSLMRHIQQWAAGQDDEDHLGHAAANLMFLICTEAWVTEGRLSASLADIGPIYEAYRREANQEALEAELKDCVARLQAEYRREADHAALEAERGA